MKRSIVVALAGLFLLSCAVTAGGIGGGPIVTTVGMGQVNALIDQYNEANQAQVGRISFAWGGEIGVSMWRVMGVYPSAGLRLLFASSTAQREKVTAASSGVYTGGAIRLGPFSAAADFGIYRATFSFPAARYDRLVGWGMGMSGEVDYTLSLGSSLQVSFGIRLQWEPIRRLRDREGGVYESRTGAFLDFSGIGAVFGISWAGL